MINDKKRAASNEAAKLKAERDYYKDLSDKYAQLIKTLLNHENQ